MPIMDNDYLKKLADESNENFKNELEKLYNGSKERHVSNRNTNTSRNVINVCRAWVSKLVNRIRKFNTRCD